MLFYWWDVDGIEPFSYMAPTSYTSAPPSPYESLLTPGQYVEFAVKDLDQASAQGDINAFGNVKRALHLTVDQMLHQYGLFVKNKRVSFPQKLELLDRAGVVSLDILRNLNLERNLVEHEYDVPERKRVREAIDVAKLLLLAMDKLAESIPYEAVIGTPQPAGHSVLRLEPLQGEIQLFRLTNGNGEFKTHHGIRTFSGRLRTLRGGLDNRYRVASTPWRRYALTRANAEAWSPILRWIIDVQRFTGTHVTSVDLSTAQVTVQVTLAWPIDGDRWTDFLDAATTERDD